MSNEIPQGWELPSFTRKDYRTRRTRYAVLIPVINEGERIRRQLESMAAFAGDADIAIVDGGSTDGSLPDSLLEQAGVRTLAVKTGPGRLSAQLRIGLALSMIDGYEGVILIDGNEKDNPEAIPRFIRELDRGYDHIQGSRFLPGGKAINTPGARLMAVRLIHAPLISLAARFHYTDTTNGFRSYSRRLLLDPRVAPFRAIFSGYELHYYLSIRAPRLGFRVEEIPVERRYPADGPPPTKISPVRGNFEVMRTLLRAVAGMYNPDSPGARHPEHSE
jgi:dolichol-phosphate mannosyltransferase